VVTGNEAGDPWSDRIDDPGARVSQDDRKVALPLSADHAEVAVADAAGDDTNSNFTRTGLDEVQRLDGQRVTDAIEHSGPRWEHSDLSQD